MPNPTSSEAIDITGFRTDSGRRDEVARLLDAKLSNLAVRYPQLSAIPRRREAAARLLEAVNSLGAEPSMFELIETMAKLNMRGMGAANESWPRLFFVRSKSVSERIDMLYTPSAQLAPKLAALLSAYFPINSAKASWALASILARRPETPSDLHSLLERFDEHSLPLDHFLAAWGPYFSFREGSRSSSEQPDWSLYWEYERATAYGDVYPPDITAFVTNYFDSLSRQLPAARILDIGTGNHAVTRLARERCPDFDVYGVDLAMPQPSGDSRILLARMNADRLAFSNQSFDAAISVNGIEYGTPALALAELRRILRPTGEVALVLHRPDSLVVRRAQSMNRFIRDALLVEMIELARLYVVQRNERIRDHVQVHVNKTAARPDVPAEPFFKHLWDTMRAILASSSDSMDAALRPLNWCAGFFKWVLEKNEYVISHAAQLGANEQELVQQLNRHGLQVSSLTTLYSSATANREIAAWGVRIKPFTVADVKQS